VPARKDTLALTAIATSIAAIDQLTKAFLIATIGPGRSASRVELADGWLALEYTENRGAAFGLLSGLVPVLTVASIAILAGLIVHFVRENRPPHWQTVATGAIAGGALGNLVDRVRLGHVIDFLSVGPWPNFNVADSAITVGVLILVWGWTRPTTGFRTAQAIDQGS
jgi:signal peptidase II